MNQDYEKWIKTEKAFWKSQNCEFEELQNGLQIESTSTIQTLWEPFLYELFQQTFQINNNLFVYSLRSNDMYISYYIDFIVNDFYIRFEFTQTSSNTIRYTVSYSSESFFDLTSEFNDVDKSTIKLISHYLQLSLDSIIHFPTFRIKLAIKELRLLTPSENFCDFEEYCLQNTI